MSCAVVYYSLDGNTEFVARTLAEKLEADPIRLTPEKEPPKGFGKMAVGGFQAIFQVDPKLPNMVAQMEPYDTVLIAFPIWAGTYPPAIGALVDQGGLLGKSVYLVATSGSGNASRALSTLRRKLGSVGVKDTLSLDAPLSKKDYTNDHIDVWIRKNQLG